MQQQAVEDGEAAGIARAFVEARRAGTALPDFPGTIPATLAGAYAVQDAALTLTHTPLAGWKVGRINPPVDGADRLSGPIFADRIVSADPDGAVDMPIFADGFGAAEAEFLLRIGTAPAPGKTAFTLEEATALIDAVHVGIEIASSPFPGINSHGPTATISDFGNNNGLVIGDSVPDWRTIDINTWPVVLNIDGTQAGAAAAAAMLDGPFGAARYLFEHLAHRGIALEPGQWISTGAVTGVHPVQAGDVVEARFGAHFSVRCTITAR